VTGRPHDGKIKAPPTVALIVVVGVEVKETSQESACHRFCASPQGYQRSQRHTLNFAPIPSKTAWREEAGPATVRQGCRGDAPPLRGLRP